MNFLPFGFNKIFEASHKDIKHLSVSNVHGIYMVTCVVTCVVKMLSMIAEKNWCGTDIDSPIMILVVCGQVIKFGTVAGWSSCVVRIDHHRWR